MIHLFEKIAYLNEKKNCTKFVKPAGVLNSNISDFFLLLSKIHTKSWQCMVMQFPTNGKSRSKSSSID